MDNTSKYGTPNIQRTLGDSSNDTPKIIVIINKILFRSIMIILCELRNFDGREC